jgi:hypothetical protein
VPGNSRYQGLYCTLSTGGGIPAAARCGATALQMATQLAEGDKLSVYTVIDCR